MWERDSNEWNGFLLSFPRCYSWVREATILYVTRGNCNTWKSHEGQGYDALGHGIGLIDLVLSRDRTARRLSQHLEKEAHSWCGYESWLSISNSAIVCYGHWYLNFKDMAKSVRSLEKNIHWVEQGKLESRRAHQSMCQCLQHLNLCHVKGLTILTSVSESKVLGNMEHWCPRR